MAISNSITQIDTVITTELPAIREALNSMLNLNGTPEIGRGTAFPSAPATYDLYFREDLGVLCYFDGANWATVHKYAIQGSIRYTMPASGGAAAIFSTPSERTIRVTRIQYQYHVLTPNNATNYYPVRFHHIGGTDINTWNTSLVGGALWFVRDEPVNALLFSGQTYVLTIGTKVGAPGNMYLGATLYGHELVA